MNINYELIDTTAPAPEKEPERQRYFIAKCREIIKEKEMELGRKLTFYDQTFGCQMNFKDSEKLNGILEDIGYVKADTEKADFVYYNTCTVRENANVRVYGRLGALKNYKKKVLSMKRKQHRIIAFILALITVILIGCSSTSYHNDLTEKPVIYLYPDH